MSKVRGVYEGKDDGRRPLHAVCVAALDLDSEYVRILFDNVRRSEERRPAWDQEWFVTFLNIPREKFKDFSFTDKELSGFGKTVLAMVKVAHERSQASQ